MKDRAFWDLIELLDLSQWGNDDAVIGPTVAALAELDESDITGFEDRLAEKLYALDTKAHARQIGAGAYTEPGYDFSADGFLYARCAVVAGGKSFYERVLRDPSKWPPEEHWFEALLTIPREAHKLTTDVEYDHFPPTDYETMSNKDGWA